MNLGKQIQSKNWSISALIINFIGVYPLSIFKLIDWRGLRLNEPLDKNAQSLKTFEKWFLLKMLISQEKNRWTKNSIIEKTLETKNKCFLLGNEESHSISQCFVTSLKTNLPKASKNFGSSRIITGFQAAKSDTGIQNACIFRIIWEIEYLLITFSSVSRCFKLCRDRSELVISTWFG